MPEFNLQVQTDVIKRDEITAWNRKTEDRVRDSEARAGNSGLRVRDSGKGNCNSEE